MITLKRVVIESPLRGDRDLNKLYARVCALDCLVRGETPYASHLFFDHPDLLDDEVKAHRELGITAGFRWALHADLRVFYLDLGESDGMKRGRAEARLHYDQPTEDRRLFPRLESDQHDFIDFSKLGKQARLWGMRDQLQMKLGRPFERIDQ